MGELKALSVSEISNFFKRIFDMEEMLYNISVYGEITGLSVSRGTAYFSVKDEDAMMSCVCFGFDQNQSIKNGDLVLLRGTPRYYVKGGKLNFNVSSIQPYGLGELYKKFLLLKDKLEKEGIFDSSNKKPIPKNAKRIGIISSETGAVIQDIKNVSRRRNPSVDLVLYPVKVQGVGAENEIISGIKFFNKYDVDIIIIARGGGSFEDLMPFNDENLAREIFKCEKAVVSAVGHETDFTICDFVSDLRAPTPSAAAELCVEDVFIMKKQFRKTFQNFFNCFNNFLNLNKESIMENFKTINNKIQNQVLNNEKTAKFTKFKFLSSIQNFYNDKIFNLSLCQKNLEKFNPLQIINQGYAKIEQNLKIIKSVSEIDLNSELNIFMKDGKVITNPKNVEVKK